MTTATATKPKVVTTTKPATKPATMQTTTARHLPSGVYDIDILSKSDGATFIVCVKADPNNLPQPLMDSLVDAEFTLEPYGAPAYVIEGLHVIYLTYTKRGSGLFFGWTDTDRLANLAELKSIMTSFGMIVRPRIGSMTEFM